MSNLTGWFSRLSKESLNELQWIISDELARREEERLKGVRNQTLTQEEVKLINQKQYVPTVKAVRARTNFSLADSKYVVDRYLSIKFGKQFAGYAGFDDSGNPVTREELEAIRGE